MLTSIVYLLMPSTLGREHVGRIISRRAKHRSGIPPGPPTRSLGFVSDCYVGQGGGCWPDVNYAVHDARVPAIMTSGAEQGAVSGFQVNVPSFRSEAPFKGKAPKAGEE
jgi:hypothetical protein